MSGVVDVVTGAVDMVTGDALDLNGSKKKQARSIKKELKKNREMAEAEKKKQKKNQTTAIKGNYESLRDGNLGLLTGALDQKIG